MINWIKKIFGTAKPGPEQPAQVVSHFHVDRHPDTQPNNALANIDLDSMSKLEIDIWARNVLNLNLDRRRTKDYMIEQIKSHLEKEN